MGYMISLELEDRACVIIGGGRAAYIKAQGLNRAGVRPEIIAEEFSTELLKLDADLVKKSYEPSDIYGAFLVFALTDNEELNKEIRKNAKRCGALVCGEDFSVPAVCAGKNITSAVICGYPQISKVLADLPLRYDDELDHFQEYRNKILNSELTTEEKRKKITDKAESFKNMIGSQNK